MPRTTIDGLTVRHSQRSQVTMQPNQPRRVVGGVLAEPQKRQRRTPQPGMDFLGPVSGFDDPVATGSFEERDDSDWSDLLDGVEGNKVNRKQLGLEDDSLLLDEEPEPAKKETRRASRKAAKKPKKKHKVRRAVLCTLLALVLIGGGVLYFWGDGIISRLTNGNSGLFSTFMSMVSETVPFKTDANGRTNVLIFGTEGYDMDGTVGNKIHDGSQLTDSIMVVSFDQETKDVAMISIPRDLKVRMACGAGKINEVYQCYNDNGQDETAGAEALMKQIGEILGLEMQYWAHVNWGSVTSIVDTLGGITVTLDEDINDYYYTHIVIKAGVPTELNGIGAVALARARHGTEHGDFTRGTSQQKILEGIVQKVMDNGVDAMQAFNLLNILGDNLRSNFSSDNIKAGVQLLSGFDIANMRQLSLLGYTGDAAYLTTSTIDGISFVVPLAGVNNYNSIHEYVQSKLTSDPVKRENAEIVVFNATNGYGLASAERERLLEAGFNVVSVGDAVEGSCAAQYCVYAVNEENPATKEALAAHYGSEVLPASAIPANVWPGDVDFMVLIGSYE